MIAPRSLAFAGVLLLAADARADDAGAPVSAWIVVGGDPSTVTISQLGESSLGTVAGWKCKAILASEGEPGHRIDALTVSCTKSDLMVRAVGRHVQGTPSGEPTALQIASADGSKPYRTLMFGPK